jgi:hypothetical protein
MSESATDRLEERFSMTVSEMIGLSKRLLAVCLLRSAAGRVA